MKIKFIFLSGFLVAQIALVTYSYKLFNETEQLVRYFNKYGELGILVGEESSKIHPEQGEDSYTRLIDQYKSCNLDFNIGFARIQILLFLQTIIFAIWGSILIWFSISSR